MIRGRLTLLRAIEREDLDAIWRWSNDAEVMYWWAEPHKAVSRDDVAARLASGPVQWLVIATHAGEAIGRIGALDHDRRHRHAEIALQIGERAYWGRGYGGDAIIAYLGFLFHELNLHKVWLRVEAYNARAQRAYEKCGFRRDGVFREHTFLGGRYHDSIIMSIMADEFRSAHPFIPPGADAHEDGASGR